MFDFDIDIDTSSLAKMAKAIQLSDTEISEVTTEGAKQLSTGIRDGLLSKAEEHGGSQPHTVNGVTFHNYAQSFPGLENSIFVEHENGRNSTAVTFDSGVAYYWKFVNDGHYVMDNRPKKKGSGKRNYKYRLTTLDHGNRRFQGLFFVDQGTEDKREDAVEAMKIKFIQKLQQRGAIG